MKSAYELAMERLNRTAPLRKLTEDQRRQLAELDRLYSARVAERELAAQAELRQAGDQGDLELVEKTRARLAAEKQKLQAELEAKKEKVRQIGPSAS
jgi:chromosome segregation ATPase